MPVLPSDSEQRRRRSSASQQQQGASSCSQGGQQKPLQGVFAQQGVCIGGQQQQGVYATSLEGVNSQQEQSQRAFPSCQQQEQYRLSPHAAYRSSYIGPGPGVWVGDGQCQGPAPALAHPNVQFGGGGQVGQSLTLDRQRRGGGIPSSDSMYHTCTRRPQSMKRKVVTIRENNDAESEV